MGETNRLTALALGLILAAGALPATATAGEDDQSIREQNRAWLLEHNPDYDPDETVELHTNDGVEELPVTEALKRTLDRAGDTRLQTVVSGGSEGGPEPGQTYIGDVWFVGTGSVECGETSRVAETPLTWIWLGSQFHVHDGDLGYAKDASADRWFGFASPTMETFHGSGTVHFGGNVDFYCITGDGFEILWPLVNGYVTTEASPPVLFEGPVV